MVESKAAGEQGEPGKGQSQAANDGQITVKVGEEVKTLKADEVVNLLSREAGLTQESQKIAALRDAAAKYGMDPEDYVRQAEGSFGALTKLFDAGVIDKDGNVLLDRSKGSSGPGKDDGKPSVPAGGNTANVDELVGVVEKRLGKTIEALTGQLSGLGKNVENTMKLQLKREVMLKHPELDEADALNVLDYAQANPKKDLWGHAKDAVVAKKEREKELTQVYAKKFGVDLEAWNKKNELHEQGAEGGGAAALVQGRKLSFNAKRGDPKAVTPRQAMVEFLARSQRG